MSVYFDYVPATAVLIDANTIKAIAPPNLPGTVTVRVEQWDGYALAPTPFTYTGGVPEEAFERLLLPVLTYPVYGSFGSVFVTNLQIAHKGTGAARAGIYGLDPVCYFECIGSDGYFELGPGDSIDPDYFELSGTPGRFLYVTRPAVDSLAMNLRVFDSSRAALNFGTEMPIVRGSHFAAPADEIVLIGVPTDPRFRNTLRIYGEVEDVVTVTVQGQPPKTLPLRGATTLSEPAYALFNDFPSGTTPVRVSIRLAESPISTEQRKPFWAFITVTNNETQAITTITPQP